MKSKIINNKTEMRSIIMSMYKSVSNNEIALNFINCITIIVKILFILDF